MARRTGMSQSTASHIWRAFVLKPPRKQTIKISKGPLFIEKWGDDVGQDFKPPDRWGLRDDDIRGHATNSSPSPGRNTR